MSTYPHPSKAARATQLGVYSFLLLYTLHKENLGTYFMNYSVTHLKSYVNRKIKKAPLPLSGLLQTIKDIKYYYLILKLRGHNLILKLRGHYLSVYFLQFVTLNSRLNTNIGIIILDCMYKTFITFTYCIKE